jgi:hypothetical protein
MGRMRTQNPNDPEHYERIWVVSNNRGNTSKALQSLVEATEWILEHCEENDRTIRINSRWRYVITGPSKRDLKLEKQFKAYLERMHALEKKSM